MSDRKLAGLWLDGEKAIITKNHDTQQVTEFHHCGNVNAEVQDGNTSEHAANNAQQTNRRKFFKEIETHLTNTEALYVTGPGTIQEELKHHLLDTAQYKNLEIQLDTAPSYNITEEMVLEETKKHFNA